MHDPHLSGPPTSDIRRVATDVATCYARKCWWSDVDDLSQVASLAAVESTRSWDPKRGPFYWYARRAAVHQVRAHLWRESSPLSGGLHDPRRCIEGVVRAPLDVQDPDDSSVASPRPELASRGCFDEDLDFAEWSRRVRRRVEQLARMISGGELALCVLFDGTPPREVASTTGVPVTHAYRAVQKLRSAVRRDPVSRSLLQHLV